MFEKNQIFKSYFEVPIYEIKNEFVGFELYKKIKDYLEEFVREVEYKSRGHVDLLKFYNDQWLHYQFSAKVLDGICRYLNRSFKKQAQEATSSFYEIKTDDVFVVYNLALSIWRDLFFSKFNFQSFKA